MGTPFYVTEQFPPKVELKRSRLFKRAKEEKQAEKRAWASIDTLYIDGRPTKDAYKGPDGLKCVVWNCNDLSAAKREDPDFVSLLSQYDLIILLESWTYKSSKIELSG
ncbi:hypothetical protein DPMN_082303 [Dreissena polymorpha]|uniref:Endonuclease/exonuclease/phosphatase domain-containing protein n=1 Tax=Dreissena polymorpha TaxID=45954 RepID=A0A9D3YAI2_DREPO|nr:hypothetical protein DPMN_082303 [Dreissena polymorpha]